MRKAILFDAIRQNGGSYQMSLNNLTSFIKNFKKKKIDFIIYTHNKNQDLDQLKIEYKIVNLTTWDFIYIFLNNLFFINSILKILDITSSFEKELLKKNVKLLIFFFVSWKSFLLNKINFTSTILDTSHIDFYGKRKFKEISIWVIIVREYLYKNVLPLSYKVITESKDLKHKIVKLYKIKPSSIISVPNLPSLLLKNKNKIKIDKIKKVRKKFNINNKFYLYPAQFWEHKNHNIILEAVKKLNKKNKSINFIFCGKDKGCLNITLKKISEYNIEKNIKVIGYIKDNELHHLYKMSEGLVMPSYFGPTNIPPVEAWFFNIPVVYSSVNASHGLDAAVYFNPNSSSQLIKCLSKLENKKFKNQLISKGKIRLKSIKRENIQGHAKFSSEIKNFKQI